MLIHEITLKNFLSFGPDGCTIPLKPLCVIIGPNGSGKSNLLEAISLLQSAPSNFARPIQQGGGIKEWIWKGDLDEYGRLLVATIGCMFNIDAQGRLANGARLNYSLEFSEQFGLRVLAEQIEMGDAGASIATPLYSFHGSQTDALVSRMEDGVRRESAISGGIVKTSESILSQLRDPFLYPEITKLVGVHDMNRGLCRFPFFCPLKM